MIYQTNKRGTNQVNKVNRWKLWKTTKFFYSDAFKNNFVYNRKRIYVHVYKSAKHPNKKN